MNKVNHPFGWFTVDFNAGVGKLNFSLRNTLGGQDHY